ncbi:MAG TPA: hypothetical protein VFZ89_13160 [Solirubrobacteraceae bacterium]
MRTVGRLGAALAVTLVVAGCGGDDDGQSAADVQKDIQAAITTALTTEDPQVKCAEVVTKRFVSTIYRSLAACKTAEAKEDEDTEPATGARLAGLEIDGDRATADVTTVGGTSDGAHGEITFAKEDDAWKVDELSVAFLRSRLTVQVGANRQGPFVNSEVRGCFTERMAKVGDAEFLELAYDAIARRDPHPTFLEILQECSTTVRDDSGVSLLRKQFESGIRESAAKDGTPEKAVNCVLQALRKSITDEEIVQLASNRKELTKRVATAMINCDATG